MPDQPAATVSDLLSAAKDSHARQQQVRDAMAKVAADAASTPPAPKPAS